MHEHWKTRNPPAPNPIWNIPRINWVIGNWWHSVIYWNTTVFVAEGVEFISVKCPFKPCRTCTLAASCHLMMPRSSSFSPLPLSTGAQLPALADSHSLHSMLYCDGALCKPGTADTCSLFISVSILFLCSVEYQTGRLLCTAVVASSKEKQTRFF